MVLQKRGLILCLIGGIALVVGAVAMYRSGIFGWEAARAKAERETRAAIEAGQRAYRRAPMADLKHISTPEEAYAALTEGVSITNTDQEEVLRQAAELLHYSYRCANGDIGSYKAWRRSRGYELVEPEEARSLAPPDWYEEEYGEPYPPDDQREWLFDRLWETASRDRSAARVVAIARGSPGVQVQIVRINARRDSPVPPRVNTGFSEEEWYGPRSLGVGTWWVMPRRKKYFDAYMNGRITVDVATVIVLLEFSDGWRHPLQLIFFKGVEDGKWWLNNIALLNAEGGRSRLIPNE